MPASKAWVGVSRKDVERLDSKASNRPERRRSAAPDMAKGLSLAFEFAGAVAIFWFLGRLVDGWLGVEPWGQVVGSLIGWIGGFLHVYYATQRPERGL